MEDKGYFSEICLGRLISVLLLVNSDKSHSHLSMGEGEIHTLLLGR